MSRKLSIIFKCCVLSSLALVAGPIVFAQSESSTVESSTTQETEPSLVPVDTAKIQELFNSSVKAYGQGEFETAEEGLQEVVKYAPNDAQPWFHLANVFALTDRPRRAVAAYSRALSLDPTLGNAWHNMGMMHVLQAANSFKALSENVATDDALHSKANELTGILLKMLGRDPGQSVSGDASSATSADATGTDTMDVASTAEPDITQAELDSPAAIDTTIESAPEVSDSDQEVEAKNTTDAAATAEPDITEAKLEPAAVTNTTTESAAEVSGSDQEIVKRVISMWAQDWSNQNTAKYISHYASDFEPRSGSRDLWVQQRHRRLTTPSFIRVEIGDLEVVVGDEKAVATFRQSYQSDQIAEVTKKTLILKLRNGNWKIVREFIPSG